LSINKSSIQNSPSSERRYSGKIVSTGNYDERNIIKQEEHSSNISSHNSASVNNESSKYINTKPKKLVGKINQLSNKSKKSVGSMEMGESSVPDNDYEDSNFSLNKKPGAMGLHKNKGLSKYIKCEYSNKLKSRSSTFGNIDL